MKRNIQGINNKSLFTISAAETIILSEWLWYFDLNEKRNGGSSKDCKK